MNQQLTAASIIQHPQSEKTAQVTFTSGKKALASIGKHFNGQDPLFLDANNNLLPGWTINNDWLVAPNAGGGLKLV